MVVGAMPTLAQDAGANRSDEGILEVVVTAQFRDQERAGQRRLAGRGVQYEIPFATGASLTPRVDVVHTPGYCGDLACSALSKNDSYDIVNARLTYLSSDDAWRVALEVTNVTDKYYVLNTLNTAYASSQPGTPRMWAISVRRTF